MNPALASIERAMARSELHNDPMHCVLEAMHDTIVELTTIRVEICRLLEAARNPVDMQQLSKCAALGGQQEMLQLIRAIDRKAWWIRAAAWVGWSVFLVVIARSV